MLLQLLSGQFLLMESIVVICHILHGLNFRDSRLVVASDSVVGILTDITRIQKHVSSVISGGTSSSRFLCESVPIRAGSSAAIEDPTFVNVCIIEYFSFLVTIVDLNIHLFIHTILDLGNFLSSEESTDLLGI